MGANHGPGDHNPIAIDSDRLFGREVSDGDAVQGELLSHEGFLSEGLATGSSRRPLRETDDGALLKY
jgi:hypothetical protein